MIGWMWIAGLAAQLPPAAPVENCSQLMRARPFTTQAEAKTFGGACLARNGAVARTLTAREVEAMLMPLISDDDPLVAAVPADIGSFCPEYARMTRGQRAVMWRTMVAAIARPESNYRTREIYWEVDQHQYSIGLLQLSLVDEANYHCGLRTEVDLTSPETNLACGTKILRRWVTRDGRIGGNRSFRTRGGARYWSTLRVRTNVPPGAPAAGAREEIIGKLRRLPGCTA